jgi:hypothetical protein
MWRAAACRRSRMRLAPRLSEAFDMLAPGRRRRMHAQGCSRPLPLARWIMGAALALPRTSAYLLLGVADAALWPGWLLASVGGSTGEGELGRAW